MLHVNTEHPPCWEWFLRGAETQEKSWGDGNEIINARAKHQQRANQDTTLISFKQIISDLKLNNFICSDEVSQTNSRLVKKKKIVLWICTSGQMIMDKYPKSHGRGTWDSGIQVINSNLAYQIWGWLWTMSITCKMLCSQKAPPVLSSHALVGFPDLAKLLLPLQIQKVTANYF